MDHTRLETLRNALDRMRPRRGNAPPGRRTNPNALATSPGALTPIAKLHMGTFHSSNGLDTAGCIAGITITLFPEAARNAAWNLIVERRWRPGRRPVPVPHIVAAILDAPHEDVCNLLYPAPEHFPLERITPEEAKAAVYRFAAGEAPWPIETE